LKHRLETALATWSTLPRSWRLLLPGLVIALLALRIWIAFTLRVNSDEPQHLHVVWAWTQGLLPFRDLFDNHAPLFQILYAPLLAALGERADIVPLMRLAVIPWYALTLWLCYRLGKALFNPRVAVAGVVILALFPTFFSRSIEFRPDDAWATAWTAAMLVAVAGRPSARRAWHVGLLGGLAVAFSIKSAILIISALASAGLVLIGLALVRRLPDWRLILRRGAEVAAGGAVLPVTIAAAFAAAGAWDSIRYCLFTHNVANGMGRWAHAGWHVWLFPLALPLIALATFQILRGPAKPLRRCFRAWVLGSALIYLALRASYQPLLDKQDILPAAPMLAPFVAVVLLRLGTVLRAPLRVWTPVAAAAALELALCLVHSQPWLDQQKSYANELGTLLKLTSPTDYVMDDKAESVFRPRALYWILENVTLFHLEQGSIADDIPRHLVDNRVAAGVFDRESGADRAFVRRNFVPVAPHVQVAGKLLGHAGAGDPIRFELDVPHRYTLVSSKGAAAGTLDGEPYVAPRDLAAGVHRFVPAHGGDWAIVWARAANLGFSPFRRR
jgi:hypothetical protein